MVTNWDDEGFRTQILNKCLERFNYIKSHKPDKFDQAIKDYQQYKTGSLELREFFEKLEKYAEINVEIIEQQNNIESQTVNNTTTVINNYSTPNWKGVAVVPQWILWHDNYDKLTTASQALLLCVAKHYKKGLGAEISYNQIVDDIKCKRKTVISCVSQLLELKFIEKFCGVYPTNHVNKKNRYRWYGEK